MYDLVADIPHYPQFLPWCDETEVLSESDGAAVARIGVAYHGIHKSFTTSNRMDPPQRIDIELVHGPFSHLIGSWKFEPIDDDSSEVSLTMEFGFATRLLDRVVGPVFRHIANGMVDAFCRRAAAVYGDIKDDPG